MKHLDLAGKKVLVRVDFNVPIKDGRVTDATRIEKALPTLQYLLDAGAKLILCTHLGRPKAGEDNAVFSTKQLVSTLSEVLGQRVEFVADCIGDSARQASDRLKNGEVLLLENTRFYPEETKGDEDFARQLASLADVYINDAFGTAHRAHASTTVVARFFDTDHKGFGFLMEAEVRNGRKILNEAQKPVVAIVGGAKVSDKIKLLEKLIDLTDHIIIGGGMAYTFIRAVGGNIGRSLVEPDFVTLAADILEKAKLHSCRIHLPEDSVAADGFSADARTQICSSSSIPDGWMGLDIGPAAVSAYSDVIINAKTILWNGPMGVFEFPAFSKGTFGVAESVALATQKGAYSLIGGGDSVAAINQAGLDSEVSFVSTGGGAMLEFLEGKELPGIAAIEG